MKQKQISKGMYISMVWIIIFLGIIGNIVFSTIGIFKGFDYYTSAYMAVSTLVIGFGMGLAYARSWKIEGVDN